MKDGPLTSGDPLPKNAQGGELNFRIINGSRGRGHGFEASSQFGPGAKQPRICAGLLIPTLHSRGGTEPLDS